MEVAADIKDIREMVGSQEKDLKDDEIISALESTDYDFEKAAKKLKNKLAKQSKQGELQDPELDERLSGSDSKDQVESGEGEQQVIASNSAPPAVSKLAKLAMSRSAAANLKGSSESNKGLSGLAKLKRQSDDSQQGNRQLKSVGLLSKIGKKDAPPQSSNDKPERSSTKLAELRNRKSDDASKPSKLASLGRPNFGKIQSSKAPSKPKIKIRVFPELDFGNYKSTLAFSDGRAFNSLSSFFDSKSISQVEHTNSIYLSADMKKVKEAFSQPSPDDVILKAQDRGFGSKSANTAKGSESTAKATASLQGSTKVDNVEAHSSEDPIDDLVSGLKKNSISVPPVAPLPDLSDVKNVRRIDVAAEVARTADKSRPNISFVVIGHVDAGKSTLMGRLLYDSGDLSDHTLNKYKKDSATSGKSSFAFAWAFDQTEEERKRGVTIDISVQNFKTEKANFTVVDAPGHKDFVPNMIAGSTQADYAVLVIDSATNAFEAGFNLDGQTKEHAILVRSLGVENVIVAVNKLDTVDWAESRYDEIKDQLSDYLTTKVGFSKKSIEFVPTSGYLGENVVKKASEPKLTSWYSGPTLIELLERIPGKGADLTAAFRLIVSDAFTGNYISGTTVTGKVDSGSVQVGETIVVMPSGVTSKVKAIAASDEKVSGNQASGDQKQYAVAGENVGLILGDLNLEDVLVGDVVCNVENPVRSVNKFTAKVIVFDLKRPVLTGTKVVLHRGRINTPAKITKIVSSINKANGEVIKKKPRHLVSGQAAVLEIALEDGKYISLEKFRDNKSLGRFVLRTMGSTIAAGVVDDWPSE